MNVLLGIYEIPLHMGMCIWIKVPIEFICFLKTTIIEKAKQLCFYSPKDLQNLMSKLTREK